MVDLKILGEDEVAGQIGDQAERPRRHHHRHRRQSVQAVGQVHGVGEADDGEGGEGHIEPADIQQHGLEEGEGDRGLEPRRGRRDLHPQHGQNARDHRHHRLGRQLLFRGQAGRGLFRHLGVVVDEAQHAEGRRHARDDPDIGIGQVAPQKDRDADARQDHQPAHGGGADLGQVGHRAVVTDRLALALFGADPVDEPAAHGRRHDGRRRQGQGRADGLVLDQVQQRILVRDVGVIEIQKVEHAGVSIGSRAARLGLKRRFAGRPGPWRSGTPWIRSIP